MSALCVTAGIQVCHCWGLSFSVDHAIFLFIYLPGLSLLVSALLRQPCSISIHFFPKSIAIGVRPFALTTQHFFSFVSQLSVLVSALSRGLRNISIHLSPKSVTADVLTFLFICFPHLSLLVSALVRYSQPYSISIHLFPRSIIASVRPFPLAIIHFFHAFISQVYH